ncbi:hypothetical protein ACE6H2_019659 [Prunus campanulata]
MPLFLVILSSISLFRHKSAREPPHIFFTLNFLRYPYVTGTSVVALKYKDGILMAADMGGSYGSTLRYKSVERMKPIGKHSLLGASGEISDFQELLRYLDELILYDNMWDDGNSLGPKEVHNYLTRVMYNRRNKFNPLWNSLVLGGVKKGQKYLGMVSMIGVNFEDNHVATGFGNHLARPILRDEWHENLTFEEGVKLLEKCMRVLLYRDRSAVNKLQISKITEEGVTISQPYSLKTFWGFSAFENPTLGAEGSWYPYVTGTSVVALKYKDGILMAADMGGSYGSTLRYKSVERMKPIGKHSLLGASGEISDFQELLRYLDELILYDNMWDDGNSLGPKEVHNYLTRVMYNRRNKFNPLWNSLVLGGVKKGQKYLGMVSMIGVNFEDNHVATGFGNHLARPILRDEWHENLTFEEGVKLLEKCMRVLLYRDRSAVNKLQISKITEEGVTISQPYSLKTFWGFSAFENPTLGAEGSWYPYVTGTSVVALKYKDGILMAADMGGSYGSTLRYKSVERMKPIGKHSLLGASGEISDFQELLRFLDELILYDNMWDDGNSLGPKEVHNYLTRVMYNRRNKFNPLWNSLVLGGVKKGQKYLGMVSMIGVNFEDNHVATGFGNHLARPILRDEWHENLTFEAGVKLLEKCMRVLLYRDRSAVNKLQISKITEEGVTISQPYSLKTFWGFSAFENPTLGAEGSW